MKRLGALIAVLALALCCLTACSQSEQLRLGTGNSEGNYYKYGTLLAEGSEGNSDVATIEVVTTSGSSANLRLLSQDFLEMGIVQADTLRDAYNGTGLFSNSGKYTGYSAVASLYTEACQIIVPAKSNIYSVEDLVGKTVSLGERESGVLQNAQQILDAYDLSEADMKPEYMSFSESAAALRKGEIDAAFITAAAPTPAVVNLAGSEKIRVISLDDNAIKTLTKRYNYYTAYTIPANTYAGIGTPVNTVGVRAVLVARNDVSDEQVAGIMALLFEGDVAFGKMMGDSMQPIFEEATLGVPIPFHTGAGKYFADHGVTVEVMTGDNDGSTVAGSQDD